MKNEIVKQDNSIIEKLILQGDISTMQPNQKIQYYNSFCQSLNLNPLTQPFQILKLNGKEKLYATKDCTEQLRRINGISITELSTQEIKGVFIVTAKAVDKNGKTDVSTGAVAVNNLSGEALANAFMKAETKAKRRVTLSICGLGILDETEIDSIAGARVENIQHEDVSNHLTEAVASMPELTEQEAKEAVAAIEKKLKACKTVAELSTCYKSLPVEMQKITAEFTKGLKEKLLAGTPVPSPVNEPA